jgi:arginine kinase
MSRSRKLVVWLNEEDHVRVISIEKGANIKSLYTRLVKGIETIEKNVEFAKHEKFGFLTL